MPIIEIPESFRKRYTKLPGHVRKVIQKAIRLLVDDWRHPSLRCKSIQGAPGIYEAWVDQNYRLTFERLPGDILRLRVVGEHDEALKKP